MTDAQAIAIIAVVIREATGGTTINEAVEQATHYLAAATRHLAALRGEAPDA